MTKGILHQRHQTRNSTTVTTQGKQKKTTIMES